MRRNKQESHHRLGDWQAKCRQSLVAGMHFGLHIISRFSCSTSLRLSVKSLPANLKMDGSDPTSTVMNKLCLRNNSAIVNTTVVLFLLLAMLAEHRNSPRAGILRASGATILLGN